MSNATSISHNRTTDITLIVHQSQYATLTMVKILLSLELLMFILAFTEPMAIQMEVTGVVSVCNTQITCI